jgi:hypothetical protein
MRFKPELTTLVVVTEDSGVNLEFDYGTGYEYIGTTAKASTDKDENFSGKFGFVCNFTAQEIKNLITEDTKTLHKPVKDISVPVITVKVRASLEHSGIDPRIRTINIQKGESIQVLECCYRQHHKQGQRGIPNPIRHTQKKQLCPTQTTVG